MKREASITPLIEKYIRAKQLYGYFEVKQTTTNTFNLSNFEPHQIPSLLAAEDHGITWKLSDADPREKPCDILACPPMASYVVIVYPGVAIFIRSWKIEELQRSQKSLTKEKALQISVFELYR